MKLGVLHYRGRGGCADVAEIARRQSCLRYFVATFRVVHIRRQLRRAVAGATIRLTIPRRWLLLLLLLLTRHRRVRSVIVGGTLRVYVVLVVMRIRDLVHRLGRIQIWDLVEASLAVGGRDAVESSVVTSRWSLSSRSVLLRLAPIARRSLVLPVLSITLVSPIHRRMSTRRLSCVVIAIILLLLLFLIPMHRGRVIVGRDGLVMHQGGRPTVVVSVDEGGLQGTNYRGMVEVAR